MGSTCNICLNLSMVHDLDLIARVQFNDNEYCFISVVVLDRICLCIESHLKLLIIITVAVYCPKHLI